MMTSAFKDEKDRDWKLRLTVGLVAMVQRETGVDIGSVTKSDTAWVHFLFGDSAKLVEVLWVLCEKRASEIGVTPEEFGELFDGRTLEAAGKALAGAIADFFPRSRVAAAIGASLEQMLDATDELMVTQVTKQAEAYSKSATSSPASSESIPEG